MKHLLSIFIFSVLYNAVMAQKNDATIHRGNELYKQKNYEASQQEYRKALVTDPKDVTASYNNGNAQFRATKTDEAIQSYDNTIENAKDKAVKEKALYNKGVALSKQQKLQESIDAWKESLKLDPNDTEARENLQKALKELKKQQEQKSKQDQEKKDKKDDQKKEQEKPQQQQSKLNKQQVEQLLKALQQKEKEIQQKMQKGSPQPNKPEKDW